jgi:hypothetical protein
MMDNDELIYINCFYYSFYIKKSELSKYNITKEEVEKETEKTIHNFNNYDSTDNLLKKIFKNIKKLNNSANILNSHKILAELKDCNFNIVYDLLTLRTIIKIYKNI